MIDEIARILVVEDEVHLAAGIQENLEAEGYSVELAPDGRAGLEQIRSGDYDLVILDVMLPRMDGYALCETVRAEGNDVAILFLTVRGTSLDRVRGLELGGDDYLAKPFDLRELLLRVKAILRRQKWYSSSPPGGVLRFGGNEFDFHRFRGRSWDGNDQVLTHKEAMILRVLAQKEGQVVSREEVLEKVWGYDVFPSTRTIDNFIVRLRKRFEPEPDRPRFFHTVRGMGYRFSGSGGPGAESGEGT